MPDTSPILALPYILPSQAQKHVTHNEALRHLDAIVQLVVVSANMTVPPAAPLPGERYIVGPAATGDWAGQDGTIAVADSGGWLFYGAQSGWRAEDLTTNSQIRFNGTEWIPADQMPDSLDQLGIGTSADATNRLAVASPATLLTHEGAGHQLKINKAQDSDTASLLFQTGPPYRCKHGSGQSRFLGLFRRHMDHGHNPANRSGIHHCNPEPGQPLRHLNIGIHSTRRWLVWLFNQRLPWLKHPRARVFCKERPDTGDPDAGSRGRCAAVFHGGSAARQRRSGHLPDRKHKFEPDLFSGPHDVLGLADFMTGRDHGAQGAVPLLQPLRH